MNFDLPVFESSPCSTEQGQSHDLTYLLSCSPMASVVCKHCLTPHRWCFTGFKGLLTTSLRKGSQEASETSRGSLPLQQVVLNPSERRLLPTLINISFANQPKYNLRKSFKNVSHVSLYLIKTLSTVAVVSARVLQMMKCSYDQLLSVVIKS